MSERAANLDLVQSQFRRQADEYARIARADDRSTDSIVALADPAPTNHLLDIACGPGYLMSVRKLNANVNSLFANGASPL